MNCPWHDGHRDREHPTGWTAKDRALRPTACRVGFRVPKVEIVGHSRTRLRQLTIFRALSKVFTLRTSCKLWVQVLGRSRIEVHPRCLPDRRLLQLIYCHILI